MKRSATIPTAFLSILALGLGIDGFAAMNKKELVTAVKQWKENHT